MGLYYRDGGFCRGKCPVRTDGRCHPAKRNDLPAEMEAHYHVADVWRLAFFQPELCPVELFGISETLAFYLGCGLFNSIGICRFMQQRFNRFREPNQVRPLGVWFG